jgi:hypothetical protein
MRLSTRELLARMSVMLGRSVLGIGVFLAYTLGSGLAFAEVEITPKAREYFKAGVSYLKDPDGARYEEAYQAFKAAYAESPSWKILGNLGIAAMKLERDKEAIDAFEKYLKEGGTELDESERAQFQRDLHTLRTGVVKVTISTTPGNVLLVDEHLKSSGTITNRYEVKDGKVELGLRAGRHRITARVSGYEEGKWEVDLSPGSSVDHAFELKPEGSATPAGPGAGQGPTGPVDSGPTPTTRPIPGAVWIGVAATGALLVGATVTGIIASGKRSDFNDKNDGSDPEAADQLRSDGQKMNLITDVLLGGAVVAGAVTTVLFLNRPEVPAEKEALVRRVRVGAGVTKSGGGMWVTARF